MEAFDLDCLAPQEAARFRLDVEDFLALAAEVEGGAAAAAAAAGTAVGCCLATFELAFASVEERVGVTVTTVVPAARRADGDGGEDDEESDCFL